jgi:hypothetical protein
MLPTRAALFAAVLAVVPPDGPALAVRTADGWNTWWRADAAPVRWSREHDAVAGGVRWRTASRGVEWSELELSGAGEAHRVRVVLVRFDPRVLQFRLVLPPKRDVWAGRWSVEEAPDDAVLALNAGQFTAGPWGWLVRDGVEEALPGRGPLAPAVVLGHDGTMRLVPPDSLSVHQSGARLAFQSYPTLLEGDGDVPLALREAGRGVDLAHRDSRLAMGELRDGRMLIAMTRFDGLGGVLDLLPLGFTAPEMVAVMGALGCRRAVLLDGGISSQLRLRDGEHTRTWPGLRKVALGLVAVERKVP